MTYDQALQTTETSQLTQPWSGLVPIVQGQHAFLDIALLEECEEPDAQHAATVPLLAVAAPYDATGDHREAESFSWAEYHAVFADEDAALLAEIA